MDKQDTEVKDTTNQSYPYLSADVTRNSKGFNISVSTRTRPGESDDMTLTRLKLAYHDLALTFPLDTH